MLRNSAKNKWNNRYYTWIDYIWWKRWTWCYYFCIFDG